MLDASAYPAWSEAARTAVDPGTIRGRSCVDCGHYKPLSTCGDRIFVKQFLEPASKKKTQPGRWGPGNWISLTQGPLGIYAIPPPPALQLPGLPAIDFKNLANLFYLTSGFAFLSYLLLDQLVRSPIGETLTAIREDEVSAASLGINCKNWKVFAFAVGSSIAGAAGCFYASFVGTLVPDAFFITESFTILAMVIVGGMGTLIGPVWGAILLTVLPELLRGVGDLRLIIYGVAVTLVVLFMPGGIAQVTRLTAARFRRPLPAPGRGAKT
jgi:ABC-type branched-subunit amino acid transport system permease subunit